MEDKNPFVQHSHCYVADGSSMQDARASAAIALIELAHNIPVWAPEWSIFLYEIMQFFVFRFVMLKL